MRKLKHKRILVSVISDLVTDQRVHRVCTYLTENGYAVTLVGRSFKYSLPVNERAYKTSRLHCIFSKGILQYAEFNIKLFIKLLFAKTDVLLSNDLDTLVPNYIVSKLKSKKLVYDSHEYFTGTPELQHKPYKRKLWQSIEKAILPKLQYAYTVNQSIANLYKKECNANMLVVRNVPMIFNNTIAPQDAHLPLNRTILLMQGAGINEGRGGEELVQSMQYLPEQYLLVLIGGGDNWTKLKTLAENLQLKDRVLFIPKVPFALLQAYTKQAHLGITVDKPFCTNYALSLPNKLFDYIHAGIPVLASNLVEVKRIIDTYNIGMCIENVEPLAIANAVLHIFSQPQIYQQWKENTKIAAAELTWQKEQKVLDKIFTI